MFRRRRGAPDVPLTMLSDSDRELVGEWWHRATEVVDSDVRETTWLSATLMVQMTLGYAANARSHVPPLAYALATRSGYALRMCVDLVTIPKSLDVSGIDADSIPTLATFPVDDELGTADIPDDVSDRLLLPIVTLVSDTAEQAERFTEIVSVDPPIWNAAGGGRDGSTPSRIDRWQRDPPPSRSQPRRDRELPPPGLCTPLR